IMEYLKSKIISVNTLKNVALSFRYGIPINSFRCFFNQYTKTKPGILALGGLYDWQYLIPELSKRGVIIYFISDREFSKLLPTVKENHWQADTEKLWYKFYGHFKETTNDFIPIIKDRICWIMENSPVVARHVIHKMEDFTSNKNIRKLINGTTVYFTDYIVKQYFIMKNVPVLGWQHGSVWYDRQITQRVDLNDMLCASNLLAFGKGTQKAYQSSELKTSCKVELVGSIGLDKISKETPAYRGASSRILYIITNYYRNSWYCGFSPPSSDRLYFKEQTAIVEGLKEIVNSIERMSLTVKLCPNSEVLDEDPPWVDELKHIMETCVTLKVPIKVDAEVGPSWGELKEYIK
ncbi:hypothetical protein LCGC14_3037640, partial [marine sediment metagenome]